MADLVFEQAIPSSRAAEIHALFARAGQPGFAVVYDRAYRTRERSGLRSWIGLDGGEAVLHISVSPERFAGAGRPFAGGLMGDLMADEAHRQFWGPIKLVRRMVADVRAAGALDFLLTSFLPAAEGVFRAAGFQRFAPLQRHVMPTMWPYPVLRRLQHGERRPRLRAMPFDDARVDALIARLPSPDAFRPVVSHEYYATRMPRQEYPAGTWLVAGVPEAPDAMVLVSPAMPRGLTIADVLWRDATTPLAGVLSAVGGWAARNGYRRLYLTTLAGSRLAIEARRAGLLPRPDVSHVMLLPLRGKDEIPPPARWALTPFALTGW